MDWLTGSAVRAIEQYADKHGTVRAGDAQDVIDGRRRLVGLLGPLIEAVNDVWLGHRDDDCGDYNGCEKPGEQCAWCDGIEITLREARACLKAQEQ